MDLFFSKNSAERGRFIDVVSYVFQSDAVKPVEEDCVASLYLGSCLCLV